mgnify:CR=1 FL=1
MNKISGVYCASITPINNDFSVNKDLYLHHRNNKQVTALLDLVGQIDTLVPSDFEDKY